MNQVSNPLFPSERFLLSILRIGTAACFLGWAWQHLYWEGPYSVILWNSWLFDFLGWFGLDWDAIVGRGDGIRPILLFSRLIGIILFSCGLLAFSVRRNARWQMLFLLLGSACLLLAAYGKFLMAQEQHPMLAEHFGQILMPVILVLAIQLGGSHVVTRGVATIAVILTFAGHGAYAVGWAPTPGHFIGMIRIVLSLPGEWAAIVLQIAGWLDFAVCLAILIPTIRRPALLYAAAWGALTALARPLAGMSMGLLYWGADQYLHEALFRLPHALIPLFLFGIYQRQTRPTVRSRKGQELPAYPLNPHPLET